MTIQNPVLTFYESRWHSHVVRFRLYSRTKWIAGLWPVLTLVLLQKWQYSLGDNWWNFAFIFYKYQRHLAGSLYKYIYICVCVYICIKKVCIIPSKYIYNLYWYGIPIFLSIWFRNWENLTFNAPSRFSINLGWSYWTIFSLVNFSVSKIPVIWFHQYQCSSRTR